MAARYSVKPSNKAIDEQLNRAAEYEDAGATALPGMTYEQGVQAGIKWLIGDSKDLPIEKEHENDGGGDDDADDDSGDDG